MRKESMQWWLSMENINYVYEYDESNFTLLYWMMKNMFSLTVLHIYKFLISRGFFSISTMAFLGNEFFFHFFNDYLSRENWNLKTNSSILRKLLFVKIFICFCSKKTLNIMNAITYYLCIFHISREYCSFRFFCLRWKHNTFQYTELHLYMSIKSTRKLHQIFSFFFWITYQQFRFWCNSVYRILSRAQDIIYYILTFGSLKSINTKKKHFQSSKCYTR